MQQHGCTQHTFGSLTLLRRVCPLLVAPLLTLPLLMAPGAALAAPASEAEMNLYTRIAAVNVASPALPESTSTRLWALPAKRSPSCSRVSMRA